MDSDKEAFKRAIFKAKNGDYPEYWLQQYIKENYKQLGFDSIEGPFDTGYDFKGVYQGREVVIEAERALKSFIQHKHDHNEVDILITMNADYKGTVRGKKPTEWKKLLPKKIIVVDPEVFIKKTHEMRKTYAIKKEKQTEMQLFMLPFYSVSRSLRSLYGIITEQEFYEGTPEDEMLNEAVFNTAVAYFQFHKLDLEFLSKSSIFTKIDILANDLIKSRRTYEQFTEEEKKHIEYWLEFLDLEFKLFI